jgi:hypothetical protein
MEPLQRFIVWFRACDSRCHFIGSLGVIRNSVSLRDAARLVIRVRRALQCGVGDVRSNDTVHGLLAIAEQWVDEQGGTDLTDLTALSPAAEDDGLPVCAC